MLWPRLRQARGAGRVGPELVALYPQRADLPFSAYIESFDAVWRTATPVEE